MNCAFTCVLSQGLFERSSVQSAPSVTAANWHFTAAVPAGRFLLIRSLPEASRIALADIFCHLLTTPNCWHENTYSVINKSTTDHFGLVGKWNLQRSNYLSGVIYREAELKAVDTTRNISTYVCMCVCVVLQKRVKWRCGGIGHCVVCHITSQIVSSPLEKWQ